MGLAAKGHFKYNFWAFPTEPFAHLEQLIN